MAYIVFLDQQYHNKISW